MKPNESEGKIRYDSSAILYMLVILEKEPVSRAQLTARLAAVGINYTERTINRRLLEAETMGFSFERKNHQISLQKTGSFALLLLQLLARWCSESAALRSVIVGTIDPVRAVHQMNERSAAFLSDIVKAVIEGRIVEFEYTPQTEETSRRLRNLLKSGRLDILKKHDGQHIMVRMLPHNLVFSGADFLLLGETYFSETDTRKRQYAVAGINQLSIKEAALKKLNINPVELYQYSVNVWINGILYDLEIEEKYPAGESTRKKIKVNGEAEILSYAASKLGNLKILNPPPALLAKARETPGLCEMIFLQKDI